MKYNIEEILGKELRVERLEDKTIISRWYECSACEGIGQHEIFYNEDDSYFENCSACEGKGEIEVF